MLDNSTKILLTAAFSGSEPVRSSATTCIIFSLTLQTLLLFIVINLHGLFLFLLVVVLLAATVVFLAYVNFWVAQVRLLGTVSRTGCGSGVAGCATRCIPVFYSGYSWGIRDGYFL